MKPATPEAFKLFHEGALALTQMERNGILIDESHLEKSILDISQQIKDIEEELKSDPIFRKWEKRFGSKTSLGSKVQLEEIVFDVLGHKRTGRKTDTGKHKTDEAAFEFVDEPFVKRYFELENIKGIKSKYLMQIKRELMNGYIHPITNLHTVISLRSSADRPSIQNFPVRDPLQGEVIRRCIIAPLGYRVGEIDISGNEVRWSAVYHHDPMMLKYILDPKTDMHRDMAMECYILKNKPKDPYWKEDGKLVRYVAKNRFVFPEFYGSYFMDCAKSMWEAIDLYKLKTSEGKSLKKYLKRKGIKELGEYNSNWNTGIKTKEGTFIEHIRKVEEGFWKRRFLVYAQWKKDWWQSYLERGWFKYKTGFVGSGLLNRKQVVNYPIQGAAFHGLLWAQIQLQKWLNKNKMKTKIVAEIHDSLVMYLWHSEIDEVLAKAKEIITATMLKHWAFINVPFEVEAEVAPKGGSWFDKKPRSIVA